MTSSDPPKPDVSKIPVHPVVEVAAQSIAKMYSTVIGAMSTDAAALLAKNGASNPPPAKSVQALTADIIALLSASLRAVFPGAGAKPGDGASSSDTENP